LSRRALICGISGQDGAYLSQLLLAKGYEVWGTSRDAEMATFANLEQLGLRRDLQLVSLNLRDTGGILSLIQRAQPDEIYSLAAQSSVGLSFQQPFETIESIALGAVNLLEAIRFSGQTIKLYNAGSTECFGDTGKESADENSPFHPCSPYAVAKAASYWTISNYRQAYGMYACTGVLSNHDSPLRPARFVTKKIIRAAAEVAAGKRVKLALGNLAIERDWGWAPDYVDAIWRMLQEEKPSDYIVATGVTSTLRDFLQTAFRLVGHEWEDFVVVDRNLFRPSDLIHSRVNPRKASDQLGWHATNKMQDVVRLMLDYEIDRGSRELGR